MKSTTKIVLFFLICLSLIMAPLQEAKALRVLPSYTLAYAPALFGTSQMSMTYYDKNVDALLTNKQVSFRFVNASLRQGVISGYLSQYKGAIIYDFRPATGQYWRNRMIPFTLVRNGDAFQGYIYFRGHNRKFCGGVGYIPSKCLYVEP